LVVQKSAVDEKQHIENCWRRNFFDLSHAGAHVFMNENVERSARTLGAENDVRRRVRANIAERVIIDSVTPEELTQCYRRWGGDHSLKPPDGGSPLTDGIATSGLSYSAVPGPIAGAGLPGLLLARRLSQLVATAEEGRLRLPKSTISFRHTLADGIFLTALTLLAVGTFEFFSDVLHWCTHGHGWVTE
jgi:hypothetical protein